MGGTHQPLEDAFGKGFYGDTHSHFLGERDQNLLGSSYKTETFVSELKNLLFPGLSDIKDKVCVPLISDHRYR